MNDRDRLILKLKYLIKSNKEKQLRYQQLNNTSDDVGFLTKEACLIASLLPKMQSMGVTFDDCCE